MKHKRSGIGLELIGAAIASIVLSGCGGGSGGPQSTPSGPPKIIYSSRQQANQPIGLFTMNPDGSGITAIAQPEPGSDLDSYINPAISPDGKRIVFQGFHEQDCNRCTPSSNLYIMNIDGSGLRYIGDRSIPGLHANPSWHPDGSQIIYNSTPVTECAPGFGCFEPGNSRLYVANADGTGHRKLVDTGIGDADASYSFDGRRIVFTSYPEGNGEIYVMDADGSNRRRLTNDPAGVNSPADTGPVFSPDGSRIAWVSRRGGTANIWVMDSQGSNQRRLTSAGASNPSWSPDGQTIAFTSSSSGNPDIYTINADGSDLRKITDNPLFDSYPAYFSS